MKEKEIEGMHTRVAEHLNSNLGEYRGGVDKRGSSTHESMSTVEIICTRGGGFHKRKGDLPTQQKRRAVR